MINNIITKNQIKLIASLASKKFRLKYGLFVIEGVKLVQELIDTEYEVEQIYVTHINHSKINYPHIQISDEDYKKISFQKNPEGALALVKFPKKLEYTQTNDLELVLDDINDPGNLGAIIRTADWYGIKNIICSNNSVDIYNTKVVQATKGSIFRVKLYYKELDNFLNSNSNKQIICTDLEGEIIDKSTINNNKNIYLIMGNEANGVSENLKILSNKCVKINSISNNVESLNVSIATAIMLDRILGK